jgi:hypothetical protein
LVTADARTPMAVPEAAALLARSGAATPGRGVLDRPRTQVVLGVDERRFVERLVASLLAPLPVKEGPR